MKRRKFPKERQTEAPRTKGPRGPLVRVSWKSAETLNATANGSMHSSAVCSSMREKSEQVEGKRENRKEGRGQVMEVTTDNN